MDCDPTAAFSGKRIKKKVSWAFNLEKVMYFSPDVEIQQFREPEGRKATAGSMQTNLEGKLHALKSAKRFASVAEIADRDFLRWLQEKSDQAMDKISGKYGAVSFKDLTLSEKSRLTKAHTYIHTYFI